MPSIDHLDDTDDEILTPRMPRLRRENKRSANPESMNFVSTHFGDTSESDDDTLTKDLKFPDIHEIQSPEPSQSVAKQQQEAGMALLASSIVSQTFTSMMQSAMSGLKMAAPSSNGSKVEKVSYNKDESNINIQSEDKIQASLRRPSSDSDVDIADEFEFLEQYDVDNSEETK